MTPRRRALAVLTLALSASPGSSEPDCIPSGGSPGSRRCLCSSLLRASRAGLHGARLCSLVLGSLNMWSYDRVVTPALAQHLHPDRSLVALCLHCLGPPSFLLRGQALRAVFALPVLWSAVEYLAEFRSVHSTWGNLAYTQMDCLPLIQIASITGIWSISFVVLLFPSTIAVLLAPRPKPPVTPSQSPPLLSPPPSLSLSSDTASTASPPPQPRRRSPSP